MSLWSLILREIRYKPRRFLYASIAIIAAISVLVCVRMLAQSSYSNLMEDLHDIGSGYLVIASDATAVSVLRGEETKRLLPENIIPRIASLDSGILGDINPRIYRRITIQEHDFILTGVFRPNELKTKNDEDIAAKFLKNIALGSKRTESLHESHGGMGHRDNDAGINRGNARAASGGNTDELVATAVGHGVLATGRSRRLEKSMFQDLGLDEIIVGAAVATALGTKSGDELMLFDSRLKVKEVLESTGDRDDVRLFVHIRTAQRLVDMDSFVSCIEVMGCCVDKKSAAVLKADIQNNAKQVKVVTVEDVAKARMNSFSLSKKITTPLVLSLLLIGIGAVASHTVGSLRSRRREIGILVALGATGSVVHKMFLAKAAILGVWSGTAGYAVGSSAAWFMGRFVLDYPVAFEAAWFPLSVAGASTVTIMSTLIPVLEAARREPAFVLRDE